MWQLHWCHAYGWSQRSVHSRCRHISSGILATSFHLERCGRPRPMQRAAAILQHLAQKLRNRKLQRRATSAPPRSASLCSCTPAIAQRTPPSTHPPEPPSHLRPRLHQGSTKAPPRLLHQPEPPTRRLRRLRHPRPRATLSAHTCRSGPRAAARSSTRTTYPRQPRSQRNLPIPISVKPPRGVPGTRTSGRCARKRRFSTGKVLP